MNLDGISFFRLASDRLDWLGERQRVISENIANANTPNYRARDVTSFDRMLDGTRGAGLQVTHPDHIAGSARTDGVRVQEDPDAVRSTIDGNTVALEEQTIRASETADTYRMAAELYRKGHALLTLSVGGN